MTVDAFLAMLHGVRRGRTGWIARCPAHEDRSPSLSICSRDGKILVHCFAGCPIESICAAIGIGLHDLFIGMRASGERKPIVVREAEKQITGLRSRLTVRDRERAITIVLANRENPDPAMARALALAVEGELTQVVLENNQ